MFSWATPITWQSAERRIKESNWRDFTFPKSNRNAHPGDYASKVTIPCKMGWCPRNKSRLDGRSGLTLET